MSCDRDPANHLDVHPPGHVFFSWLVTEFCSVAPFPEEIVQSRAESEAIHSLVRSGVFPGVPDVQKTYSSVAMMQFLARLGVLLSSLLIFFAALDLSLFPSRTASLWSALFLAVTASSALLFFGHYDIFLFFLSALAFFLIIRASRRKKSLGLYYALAAGLTVGAGCACSVAFGFYILIAAALFFIRQDWHAGFGKILAFATGGMILTGSAMSFAGVNLINCAFYAIRNNARFFEECGRLRWEWIPWNYLDLILFGTPGALIFAFFLWGKRVPSLSRAVILRWTLGLILLYIPAAAALRGEFGRLLLFLSPGILILACAGIFRFRSIPVFGFSLLILAQGFLFAVLRVFLRLTVVW